MKKEYFKDKQPFINRKKEQEFLTEYLEANPKNILFIYGPKSTGKTTLINKVLANLDQEIYAISFMSMRGKLIRSFKDFKSSFFPASLKGKVKDIVSGISFNTGFFGWDIDDETLLEEDVFALMLQKLKKARARGKKPVIIIDEFQYLRDIPFDDENGLNINQELFKLFIEITKVYNLAHVVCLTSDSYYMEELYNDTKLSNTSDFKLINHLSKEDIYFWLREKENCPEKMVEEIWENIGGSVWEIWQIFVDYKNTSNWKPKLADLLQIKYSYLADYYDEHWVFEEGNKKDKELFLRVTKTMSKDGKYIISRGDRGLGKMIKDLVSRDIWFFDTKTRIITPNSKSFQIAMGRLIKDIEKS